MATLEQIEQALRAADAAGNVEDAKMLASAYAQMRNQKSPQIEAINPTDGMSGLDKFRAGAGKALVDTWRGGKQLLNIGDQEALQREIDDAKTLDKPLMNTGSGLAGNLVGNVAASLPTALIPGANTLTGATALGAGLGLLSPTASDESALNQAIIGGAGSGALNLAGRTLPHLFNSVREPFTQPGREKIAATIMSEMTGIEPKTLSDKLLQTKINVPNTKPSFSESLVDNPKAAVLQKAIRNNPLSGDMVRLNEYANNQARFDALKSIAGDDAKIAAAEEARRMATRDQYQNLPFVQSDPDLERILSTPAAQKAIPYAQEIAGNQYRKFGEEIPTMKGLESSVQTVGKDAVQKDHWSNQPINYERDNLLTAIRKLGGISKEMAQDTYGNRMWEDGLGHGIFRNNGGQSLDDLASRLSEHGYLPEGSGPYELVETLYKGNADNMYSAAKKGFDDVYRPEMTQADEMNQRLDRLISALENKNAPNSAKEAPTKTAFDTGYWGRDLQSILQGMKAVENDPLANPVIKSSIKQPLTDYKNWLNQKLPELGEADARYAELSKPINQMQIGQALYNKLVPALTEKGIPTRSRADAFSTAIRDQESNLIKNATGRKNQTLSNVMTPEQMATINGIQSDLTRKANALDNAAAQGSDTSQNIIAQGLLSNAMGPFGMPKTWVNRAISRGLMNTGVGKAATLFGVEDALAKELGKSMSDTKYAAGLLKALADKKPSKIDVYSRLFPALGAQGLLTSLQQ